MKGIAAALDDATRKSPEELACHGRAGKSGGRAALRLGGYRPAVCGMLSVDSGAGRKTGLCKGMIEVRTSNIKRWTKREGMNIEHPTLNIQR